jgi:hypothetical protein
MHVQNSNWMIRLHLGVFPGPVIETSTYPVPSMAETYLGRTNEREARYARFSQFRNALHKMR